jgi:hypothetical protein
MVPFANRGLDQPAGIDSSHPRDDLGQRALFVARKAAAISLIPIVRSAKQRNHMNKQ